ncbi:MAG: GNAT family N-acetyltransferase [Clostridiales Family XIII bacterium]|jgi:GNAT superfamily N-acetyltransferase|nr:GNAT family N-acetyltransferase [Clostridiales Family XIII bacterium]
MSAVTIRYATEADTALILDFIRELAVFEGMGDEVVATETDLHVSLFERGQAEVIIAETGGEPVAFALFFQSYSTFLGKANLFLDDLFVREPFRGVGIGTAMLRRLARIAVERKCGRLDWLVLDGNADGAAFYKKQGAAALTDRRVYRLDGEGLAAFAAGESGTGRRV